jgi:hypothetical protein
MTQEETQAKSLAESFRVKVYDATDGIELDAAATRTANRTLQEMFATKNNEVDWVATANMRLLYAKLSGWL